MVAAMEGNHHDAILFGRQIRLASANHACDNGLLSNHPANPEQPAMPPIARLPLLSVATLLLLLTLPSTAPGADIEPDGDSEFRLCLAELREHAAGSGVAAERIESAFATIRHLPEVVRKDRNQAEFVERFGDYLSRRVNQQRIDEGKKLIKRERELLWRLLNERGVAPQIVVALWGLETNYGSYTGNYPLFSALATLSCDPRRNDFFRKQLIAALEIVDDGIDPATLSGSWAGALGHTQFMPSTWRDFAVDGDGDGKRDLIRSKADALASAANYLASLGWQGDQRWGREVLLPTGFPYDLSGLERHFDLKIWHQLEVKNNDGTPLNVPSTPMYASLILPEGKEGPAFLVYDNFLRLMEWNRSINYALSVGILSDRLVGRQPLVNPGNHSPAIRREDIRRIQQLLSAHGIESGPLDGRPGEKTREAIRTYQIRNGLPADGYPDLGLLRHLGGE
jgi:membrane-bound lytic murein transglycosylase B